MERNTEELYKKDFKELDYSDGVVSHTELDILECKVKWALGSTAVNKANECKTLMASSFRDLSSSAGISSFISFINSSAS